MQGNTARFHNALEHASAVLYEFYHTRSGDDKALPPGLYAELFGIINQINDMKHRIELRKD